MRSFLLLTGGLLLGAASIIFAAPVGNFEVRLDTILIIYCRLEKKFFRLVLHLLRIAPTLS